MLGHQVARPIGIVCLDGLVQLPMIGDRALGHVRGGQQLFQDIGEKGAKRSRGQIQNVILGRIRKSGVEAHAVGPVIRIAGLERLPRGLDGLAHFAQVFFARPLRSKTSNGGFDDLSGFRKLQNIRLL